MERTKNKNTIKKISRIFLIAVVFIVLAIFWKIWLAKPYVIEDYQINYQLDVDGSVQVQEEITFNYKKKGTAIRRDIAALDNYQRPQGIHDISVQGGAFSIDKENPHSILLGEDQMNYLGKQSYQISYSLENMIKNNGEAAEISLRIIDQKRPVVIEKSSFTIKLPKEKWFIKENIKPLLSKKSGKSRDRGIVNYVQNNIFGSSRTTLRAAEQLVLTLSFQEGYFANAEQSHLELPSSSRKQEKVVRDRSDVGGQLLFHLLFFLFLSVVVAGIFFFVKHVMKVLGIEKDRKTDTKEVVAVTWVKKKFLIGIVLIVILLILFNAWDFLLTETGLKFLVCWIAACCTFSSVNLSRKKVREKSEKKTITIYYTPPKDVDFFLAVYIYTLGLNAHGLIAIVYYRASKWWVQLMEKKIEGGGSIYFMRKTQLDPPLGSVDYELFDLVFYPETTVSLGAFVDLIEIKKKLIKQRVGELEKKLMGKSCTENFLDQDIIIWEEKIYDKLRGFGYYLSKVKKEKIQHFLKKDPLYVSEKLCWLVLFWLIDTPLLSFALHQEQLRLVHEWKYRKSKDPFTWLFDSFS